jgi:hypothetical protein
MRALELLEDLWHWFSHDIGQHVQTASVGHAECERLDAELRPSVDHALHAGDTALASFQAKPLGCIKFVS